MAKKREPISEEKYVVDSQYLSLTLTQEKQYDYVIQKRREHYECTE